MHLLRTVLQLGAALAHAAHRFSKHHPTTATTLHRLTLYLPHVWHALPAAWQVDLHGLPPVMACAEARGAM
jgi:hypothetical protein